MNNIINRVWNRGTMVNIEDLRGSLYQNEQLGHTFVISGVDSDGNTVSLSGTVDGAFLRPDNTTVAISGSASGGKAYVTLPANCYDVPGKCGLTIYLTADSQKTALYAAVVTVTRTSSDTASPGTTASVVDLVNAINAAISQIPATDTALKAAMAPTYSNTGLYAVGSYAWHNGTLYRCTTAITTAESWTSGHWTDAALGNDLRDLKSAFEDSTNIKLMSFVQGYYDNGTVGSTVNSITPSGNFVCAIAPCNERDIITVNVIGGGSARAWAYLDSDHKVLISSNEYENCEDIIIPFAPTNAAYITINNRISFNPTRYYARIGEYPVHSINKLNSALSLTTGNIPLVFSNPIQKQYINTSGTIANINSPSIAKSSVKYCVVECTENDKFTVTGVGGNADRLWAFVASNGKIIKKAESNATLTNGLIIAPAGAAYLVVNDESDSQSYVGEYVVRSVSKLKSQMNVNINFSEEDIRNRDIRKNGIWYEGSAKSAMVFIGNSYGCYVKANANYETFIAFLTTNDVVIGESASYSAVYSGRINISAGESKIYIVPDDAKYLYVLTLDSSNNDTTPTVVIDASTSYLKSIIKNESDDVKSRNAINIVFANTVKSRCDIRADNKWHDGGGYSTLIYIGNAAGCTVTANNNYDTYIAFLKSNIVILNQRADFSSEHNGRITIPSGTSIKYEVPNDAKYLYVLTMDSSANDRTPSVIIDSTGEYLAGLINTDKKENENDNCYSNVDKKAGHIRDVKWNALSAIPRKNGESFGTGEKTGIPYSSVKEYDKFVGYQVSVRTFMTAAHNPYSLLYTEDTNGNRSRSGYGITYHGTNCGSYFGAVCNTLVGYAVGFDIPWNTGEFAYLRKIGMLQEKADQSAKGVQIGDIVWEPGHGNIITDVIRDSHGTPTKILWTETGSYLPLVNLYTPEQFDYRVKTNGGILYTYTDIYKNAVYKPSEFVAEGNEPLPPEYIYNEDVCTFAGDYASFYEGEEIWINYNLGSTVYTSLIVRNENGTSVKTESLDTNSHKKSIGNDLTSGFYTAELSDGTNTSEPTYFEVIQTEVEVNVSGTTATVDFESENGTPLYAQAVYQSGASLMIYPLSAHEKTIGQCSFDFDRLHRIIYGDVDFNEPVYLKVFFMGRYGIVRNNPILIYTPGD